MTNILITGRHSSNWQAWVQGLENLQVPTLSHQHEAERARSRGEVIYFKASAHACTASRMAAFKLSQTPASKQEQMFEYWGLWGTLSFHQPWGCLTAWLRPPHSSDTQSQFLSAPTGNSKAVSWPPCSARPHSLVSFHLRLSRDPHPEVSPKSFHGC